VRDLFMKIVIFDSDLPKERLFAGLKGIVEPPGNIWTYLTGCANVPYVGYVSDDSFKFTRVAKNSNINLGPEIRGKVVVVEGKVKVIVKIRPYTDNLVVVTLVSAFLLVVFFWIEPFNGQIQGIKFAPLIFSIFLMSVSIFIYKMRFAMAIDDLNNVAKGRRVDF
jgi:hypothetical protein